MSYLTVFDSRISGIPCQIGVVTYSRQKPGRISLRDAECPEDFYGWTDTDYEVLDQKGKPASWLQEKLTDDDFIIDQIKEHMEPNEWNY